MAIFILFFAALFLLLFVLFIRKPSLASVFSIIFSGVERFSTNVGFTLSPIVFLSFILIPVAFVKERKGTLRLPRALLFVLGGILLSTGLSIVFSHYRIQSVKSSLFVFIYSLLLVSEYIFARKYSTRKVIFISIAVSLFVFSLYALIQNVRFYQGLFPDIFTYSIPGNDALSPLSFVSQGTIRPNSFFNDVNTSAGFLLLYAPFIFIYTFEWICRVRRQLSFKNISFFVFSVITLSFVCYAFYLMSSRASLISIPFVAFGLYLFLILYYKRLRKPLIGVLIGVVVLLSVFTFTHRNFVINKAISLYNGEYSAQAHVAYVESALREFSKNPVVGGGTGSYYPYFKDEQKTGKYGYYPSVDNPPLFIKYLAENGIFGLITNAALIIYVLIAGYSTSLKSNRPDRWYTLAFTLGFIGLVSANLFHAFFPLFFSAVFIGVFLGLIDKQAEPE